MALLDGVLDRLGDLGAVPLHLTVAGLAFAETALFLDLLVPGEVGMVLVGAAAHRAGIPLPTLIAAGAAGAVIGDSCSYAIGRAVAAERLRGSTRIARGTQASRERAEVFFGRHGGRAVFFGRWIGALRAVVPFVAGAARMPYGRFLVWNVAASIAWVATVVGAGWFLGEAVAGVVDDLSTALSAAVVVALLVVVVIKQRGRRRAERARREPGEAPTDAEPSTAERRYSSSVKVTSSSM